MKAVSETKEEEKKIRHFFCASETSEFCKTFKRQVANLAALSQPVGGTGEFPF